MIDRTACTGRTACAHLLAGAIERDEWGYPIVVDPRPDRREAAIAAALCPDGALHVLSDDDHHQTRRPR
ncbi:ferredoxin [Gordonia sp. X0973]|uniref:ferredoxin n=1 Tax=Gordonia sp. X0973 TaxID=2742602 RepID=UPI001597D075|nr:ferredoxin [Gordonia sp. X0973]QKT07693.1 ferredoxin [Gordonia sp. X0973]